MDILNKPRPCGCKGCRTCLICETDYGIVSPTYELSKEGGSYVYCPICDKAWPGWDVNTYKQHPLHSGYPIEYPGVYIKTNFLTDAEEQTLIDEIDKMPWAQSQSGRRKQNFGPKCNFKKRKLQLGEFQGFPLFSKFVQHKFEKEPLLANFQTIEQCSLEYSPQKGASIDPHIDDCWIWGERIVTINLLADSVLTMSYNKNLTRYNLDCVVEYPKVLNDKGHFNSSSETYKIEQDLTAVHPVVRIPMPRKSLLVLFGAARYNWEHRVLRNDIKDRRVCLAYREFTPPYLPGGREYEKGRLVLEKAVNFF